MTRTFRLLLCVVAVLLASRLAADEPKKEPEKKQPAPSVQDYLDPVTAAIQRIREARARAMAAENLRQIRLALQKDKEEPKQEPNKDPKKDATNPNSSFNHLQ